MCRILITIKYTHIPSVVRHRREQTSAQQIRSISHTHTQTHTKIQKTLPLSPFCLALVEKQAIYGKLHAEYKLVSVLLQLKRFCSQANCTVLYLCRPVCAPAHLRLFFSSWLHLEVFFSLLFSIFFFLRQLFRMFSRTAQSGTFSFALALSIIRLLHLCRCYKQTLRFSCFICTSFAKQIPQRTIENVIGTRFMELTQSYYTNQKRNTQFVTASRKSIFVVLQYPTTFVVSVHYKMDRTRKALTLMSDKDSARLMDFAYIKPLCMVSIACVCVCACALRGAKTHSFQQDRRKTN